VAISLPQPRRQFAAHKGAKSLSPNLVSNPVIGQCEEFKPWQNAALKRTTGSVSLYESFHKLWMAKPGLGLPIFP
jgi:hypothetical protein